MRFIRRICDRPASLAAMRWKLRSEMADRAAEPSCAACSVLRTPMKIRATGPPTGVFDVPPYIASMSSTSFIERVAWPIWRVPPAAASRVAASFRTRCCSRCTVAVGLGPRICSRAVSRARTSICAIMALKGSLPNRAW